VSDYPTGEEGAPPSPLFKPWWRTGSAKRANFTLGKGATTAVDIDAAVAVAVGERARAKYSCTTGTRQSPVQA
jgi:hypothetical protein